MGVAFVFIFYVVGLAVLTVLASVSGAVLGTLLSRGPHLKLRRRFQVAGVVLPFLGAGYVISCIITMAAFGLVTHRDFGFGDGFEVPLNNQYQFSAIDLPNIATLYRRGGALIADSSSSQIGASSGPVVENVFSLQESGDWLYGARGTENPQFADDKRVPNRWFLLNTRLLKLQEFASEAEFEQALRTQHLEAKLRPSEDFYGAHRYRWYDALVVSLLLTPPSLALWIVMKTVKRMRASAASASESGDLVEDEIRYPGFLRPGRFLR